MLAVFFRILVGLDYGDVKLVLKQYNSYFTTFENSAGIHSFEDISEVLSRGFQNELETRGPIRPKVSYDKSDSNIIECDNITKRTKLIVKDDIPALMFDQKMFSSSILGLSPQRDFKRNDEDFGEKS